MQEIVGVRFKKIGKIYFFNPAGITLKKGQNVIVETARGIELGEVAIENRKVDEDKIVAPLKNIMRVATKEDENKFAENEKKAQEAYKTALEKIEKHQLEMKLVDVEYTFDNSKLLFYFTADGRIDFRELVKDLASVYKTRIELRQIGVRDEVKMLGGLRNVWKRTLLLQTPNRLKSCINQNGKGARTFPKSSENFWSVWKTNVLFET